MARAARYGLIAAALAGLASVGLALAHVSTPGDFPNDLLPDYVSARALLDGADPYAPTHELIRAYVPDEGALYPLTRSQRNPHTPVHIVLMVPFALLGYTAARVASVLVEAIAIGVAMTIVFGAVGMSRWGARALGIGVLALPLVAVDLRYGQVNGMLLLIAVLAWRSLRRPGVTGALVGFAAAFRVFPAMLLVALWRKRGAMIGALAAGAGATLVAGVILGPSAIAAFLRDATSDNLGVWGHTPWNISGSGLLVRVLTPADAQSPDERVVTWVAKAIVLAVMAGLVALAVRTPALRSGDRFWACVPLMILASPIAWEHYQVLLLPAAVLALARRRGDRLAWLVYGAIFVRVGQVGSWLADIGVPVGGVMEQQTRFVLTFGLLVVAASLEFRSSAPARVPGRVPVRVAGVWR